MPLVFFTFSRVLRLTGVYTSPPDPLQTPSRPSPDLFQAYLDAADVADVGWAGVTAASWRKPCLHC
eukprot:906943-Prorocentrum_minimum.AAC.1